MPEYWKIRFVGGPWHNRFKVVRTDRPVFEVIVNQMPVVPLTLDEMMEIEPEPLQIEAYSLRKFVSEGGAVYFQLVHESLANNPPRWVYDDVPISSKFSIQVED